MDLITAVRYDTYDMSDSDGHSLEGDRVSPKVTAAYSLFNGFQLFATYAEGYRAPSVTETFIAGTHPQPAPFELLPNPNLLPETAHNVEGGANLKFNNVLKANDAFRAKIVGFRNKVDNYIDGVSVDVNGDDSNPPPCPGNPGAPYPTCIISDDTFQYQNIANALLEGVELEATYDARLWFASIGAQHIRGTNEDTDQPLLTIPADQITLTAGFRAFDDKLLAGSRVRLVASQDRVPHDATGISLARLSEA